MEGERALTLLNFVERLARGVGHVAVKQLLDEQDLTRLPHTRQQSTQNDDVHAVSAALMSPPDLASQMAPQQQKADCDTSEGGVADLLPHSQVVGSDYRRWEAVALLAEAGVKS